MRQYIDMKIGVSADVIRRLHHLRSLYRANVTDSISQSFGRMSIAELLAMLVNADLRRAIAESMAHEQREIAEATNDAA